MSYTQKDLIEYEVIRKRCGLLDDQMVWLCASLAVTENEERKKEGMAEIKNREKKLESLRERRRKLQEKIGL